MVDAKGQLLVSVCSITNGGTHAVNRVEELIPCSPAMQAAFMRIDGLPEHREADGQAERERFLAAETALTPGASPRL